MVEVLSGVVGEGVMWAPADSCCVAGRLFVEDAIDHGWHLTGRVIELRR
jgi:hypothetical protein